MWQNDAACKGMETLFCNRGTDAKRKAICNTCGVANECLNEAMRNEDYSEIIWGGFNGKERKRLAEGTVW